MATKWRPAMLTAFGMLLLPALALGDGGGGGGGDVSAKAQDPAMVSAVQAIDARQYARAIPMLEEIVTRQPDNADAYNWLAYATRKNGDPAKSIPIYEKALALDPKHRGAHEYIGEAYLALDDLSKAKEHLARLSRLCLFGCEQYRDLKKAVEAYEKRVGTVKPAATRN
ncbi:MAG TPA: tetratricopeptide repeat protein [Methylomirabilota bacterium]|nr:tetratricopeptide repeat protein [Methylomirabilota bacterium]